MVQPASEHNVVFCVPEMLFDQPVREAARRELGLGSTKQLTGLLSSPS